MIEKKDIKEMKEFYEMLAWQFIKRNKEVPKTYNDILDLIDYMEENGE